MQEGGNREGLLLLGRTQISDVKSCVDSLSLSLSLIRKKWEKETVQKKFVVPIHEKKDRERKFE